MASSPGVEAEKRPRYVERVAEMCLGAPGRSPSRMKAGAAHGNIARSFLKPRKWHKYGRDMKHCMYGEAASLETGCAINTGLMTSEIFRKPCLSCANLARNICRENNQLRPEAPVLVVLAGGTNGEKAARNISQASKSSRGRNLARPPPSCRITWPARMSMSAIKISRLFASIISRFVLSIL